jgi:hypothetical protein
MKPGTLKSVSLLTALTFATTGCENLSPGQNAAIFGSGAGILAGGIARRAGMSTGEAMATGAAVGAVVAITTYIIAKHQADERQRQIAAQRGRIASQRIARRSSSSTSKKKKPRYIAVDTVKNEKTSPKAKKAVMIYDTQSGNVVGNNVYDVQSPPPVGSTAKFDTYSAEYVGSGG